MEAANNAAHQEVPAIGQVWPGTDAIYAGKAPSLDGESTVHLILWPNKTDGYLQYKKAVEFAEKVRPDMASHILTRMQSIILLSACKTSSTRIITTGR